MKRIIHMIKLFPVRFIWFLDKKKKIVLAIKRVKVYNRTIELRNKLQEQYFVTHRVNPNVPYTKLKKTELDIVEEILTYYEK